MVFKKALKSLKFDLQKPCYQFGFMQLNSPHQHNVLVSDLWRVDGLPLKCGLSIVHLDNAGAKQGIM